MSTKEKLADMTIWFGSGTEFMKIRTGLEEVEQLAQAGHLRAVEFLDKVHKYSCKWVTQ